MDEEVPMSGNRQLKQAKDPEGVALAVLALRNYLSPARTPNDFEDRTRQALTQMQVSTATAARLLTHFDRIDSDIRRQMLGELGVADRLTGVPAKRKVHQFQKRSFYKLSTGVAPEVTAGPRATAGGGVGAVPRERGIPTSRGPMEKLEPSGSRLAGMEVGPDGKLVQRAHDYLITFEGLHCNQELPWTEEKGNSDEPYVITTAVHITKQGENVVRTERHPIGRHSYEDVDSGETRIGPREACWDAEIAGTTGEVSLTTVLMEHDEGDPNAYRDEVHAAAQAALAVLVYFFPKTAELAKALEDILVDLINWLLGPDDDLVGTAVSVLERNDLELLSRACVESTVYDRKSGRSTGLAYHLLEEIRGYAIAYRITRNPPVDCIPIIVQ